MSTKKFSCNIQVRFADLDSYGHVNNATYFTYLETARTKIFMTQGIDFMHEDILYVVAKAECAFKKPINLGDELKVHLWISHVGKASFDIDYMLEDPEGKLFATAKTVMVALEKGKETPAPLPEKFLQLVKG